MGRIKFSTSHGKKNFRAGSVMAAGLSIGLAVMTVVFAITAISTGNVALLAIGPATGVGAGLAVGASLERKLYKEGRIIAGTGSKFFKRSFFK